MKLVATPQDPATLGPLVEDLEAFGNAYRIHATYLPSDTPVTHLREAIDVVLVYPVTTKLNASTHELLASPDGTRWERLQSKDAPSAQQVEARTPDLGYAVVGGLPHAASITSASAPGAQGTNTVAIGLFVAAGVCLLVGLGFFLRGRGR